MILIDTSAWIEFLRDTGSPVCARVDELLEAGSASCHPVRMELLAGARDERHLHGLRRLLARASLVPTEPVDYEDAHRATDAGHQPSGLTAPPQLSPRRSSTGGIEPDRCRTP